MRKGEFNEFFKNYCSNCKSNNSLENLQTLCANCHRVKTHLQADYK